jgi:prepilin-type N-terminal cleavage/methylation domain-containing protein
MPQTQVTSRSASGRGFTIIELSVVLVIVALMSAILLVAVRSSILSARVASEKQVCVSLKAACTQFSQQFGFLPPLIDDSGTILDARQQPVLQDVKDAARPANATAAVFERLYSVNSLAYYVVGAGDAPVDGVDGPGLTAPKEGSGDEVDGQFSRKGKTYDAMFDVSKDRRRLQKTGTNSIQIVDRWGNPLRYYRWEPTFYDASNAGRAGTLKTSNVQVIVLQSLRGTANKKTEADFPELRGGGFAIISAGPDGKFSDQAPTGSSAEDAAKLDEDNIVEIGR